MLILRELQSLLLSQTNFYLHEKSSSHILSCRQKFVSCWPCLLSLRRRQEMRFSYTEWNLIIMFILVHQFSGQSLWSVLISRHLATQCNSSFFRAPCKGQCQGVVLQRIAAYTESYTTLVYLQKGLVEAHEKSAEREKKRLQLLKRELKSRPAIEQSQEKLTQTEFKYKRSTIDPVRS